jgi:lysophospholipase L1-like esterase
MSLAAITRTSGIMIEGDSANDATLQYQALNGILAAIDSKFIAPGGNSYRRPFHVNKATTGASSTTVAGRIAAELAANAYTHAIIQIGINDSQTAVPQATSMANVTTIMNACVAANVGVIFIGPFCNGEKSPTGQNALDTTNPGIDLFNTGAKAIVAGYSNAIYVDVRTLIWAVQEPILNAAQANSGVLTSLVAANGPGIHPNPSGVALITALVVPQLTFN